MHIVVTNLSTLAVPFSSDQDKGFVTLLEPSVPYSFDSAAVTVANVGDNPDFLEELTESFQKLVGYLKFWKAKSNETYGGVPEISVKLENKGTNGLRVLLGSNVEEVTVQPGTSTDLSSPGYIEIRELGV